MARTDLRSWRIKRYRGRPDWSRRNERNSVGRVTTDNGIQLFEQRGLQVASEGIACARDGAREFDTARRGDGVFGAGGNDSGASLSVGQSSFKIEDGLTDSESLKAAQQKVSGRNRPEGAC
jgi:hypothetical protein